VKRNANVKSKSKIRAGVVLDGSFHLNMLRHQYETYLRLTNCKRIENLFDRKFCDTFAPQLISLAVPHFSILTLIEIEIQFEVAFQSSNFL